MSGRGRALRSAAPLSKHLAHGEVVLWNDDVADQLYFQSVSRDLRSGITILLVSGVATLVLGLLYAGLLRPSASQSLSDVPPTWKSSGYAIDLGPITTPILMLPLWACVIVAVVQLALIVILLIPSFRPKARTFAVTSTRLLVLDADGALIDQASVGEITSVETTKGDDPPALLVRRRRNRADIVPISIKWIANPLEAKAIIEEALLPEPEPKVA